MIIIHYVNLYTLFYVLVAYGHRHLGSFVIRVSGKAAHFQVLGN